MADFGNGAPQFRADVLDQIALVADQFGIVHVELNLAPRRASADLRAGASAPHNDQILAQSLHVLFLVDAEAASQAHQDDHRRDPPHDAKHREESSHLVSPECGERLAQDFGESHETVPTRLRLRDSQIFRCQN